MPTVSPSRQLAKFLSHFTPKVAADARAALKIMRERLPGAIELVYDNYNGLVIGFGPNERASEAIFSIAVYPDHSSLCFIQNGPKLPDPKGILRGQGNVARHIQLLDGPKALDRPAVKAVMKAALKMAKTPLDPQQPHRIVIKSISAKQRPRRPVPAKKK